MPNDKPAPQKIPITDPNHLIDLGIALGLNAALDALEKLPSNERLTGVGMATYAIRAIDAEHRVGLMTRNVRLALRSGVDLDSNSVLWSGKPEILIEPLDLVEQAKQK